MRKLALLAIEEPVALRLIRQLVAPLSHIELTGESDLNRAAELCSPRSAHPDIIILNIDLWQTAPCQLPLPALRGLIISSDSSDQAYRAYQANAVDYLLRPFQPEIFLQTLLKAQLQLPGPSSVPPEKSYFFIQAEAKGKMVRINYADVYYIEACQNYVILQLEKIKYTAYLTLKEIEAKLPPDQFIRTHKSYIVNERRIHAVTGDFITLENQHFIKIGQLYKDQLFKRLHGVLLVSKKSLAKQLDFLNATGPPV